ncbi:MAG TPA: hypothetical protein VK212_03115 [Lentimicrobium sp.]|nr:hypothetical protein [Lentimicrobium sp.]
MKYLNFLFSLLIVMSAACNRDKDDDIGIEVPVGDSIMDALAEKDLTLKNGASIYSDSTGNEYHTMVFDIDHQHHVYKMTLEQGKKYRFAVIGQSSYMLDVSLLQTSTDTLFKGEIANLVGTEKNQIYWTAKETDIYYLSAEFAYDINFHTYTNRLIFEEITEFNLSAYGLNLRCSGDWSVNPNGNLSLVLHQTGTYKWAQVIHDTYNYRFSYDITQASGYPNNYFGADCYASQHINYGENIPASGYVFDVKGPAEWRATDWHPDGSISFDYGFLNQNIHAGVGIWHNMVVETIADSLAFWLDGDQYANRRNYMSFDNGLYILVYDSKQDTMLFRNLKFE